MTYQNDPKLHPRNSYPMAEDRTNAGWIAGGIAALAVIMGLLFMFGRDDRSTTAATSRPAATAPATTGAAVPAPTSGNGTAGAPRQNVPPAPAR
jgi:hypothetical protein